MFASFGIEVAEKAAAPKQIVEYKPLILMMNIS